MVANVCPQLSPEGFFRSIRHRHISLQSSLQYTWFTPSPPPTNKNWFQFLLGRTNVPRESDANLEGYSNSICWSSVYIGVLPISSKELLSPKLGDGDSPNQTSLLRANHYIISGHSCTIRKVAFVLVSRLKHLWKGGRELSLQLAFSRLLFSLSATRKTRPVP